MKTNQHFKLPKELKRILMVTDDHQQKSATKKLFVEAQATYLENKNRRSKERINLGDE